MSGDSQAVIEQCRIENNIRKSDPDWKDISFFKVIDDVTGESSSLTVQNTVLKGNRCDYLTDDKNAVIFEDCSMVSNIWR